MDWSHWIEKLYLVDGNESMGNKEGQDGGYQNRNPNALHTSFILKTQISSVAFIN